jgi:hypothetical protein
MSAQPHNEKPKSGKVICGCCPLPIAYVQHGRLVITSRHDNKTHTNALTIEQLRELIAQMEIAK